MKGKILGVGAISGEDDNRYSYDSNDIVNLDGRSAESVVGCEVDFEVSENVAKNIYLTSSAPLNFESLQGQLMANDVKGVRFKFLLAVGLAVGGGVIGLIPFIGWVIAPFCAIAALVFMVLAVLGARTISESPTLLKNFLLSICISFVCLVLAFIISGSALLAAFAGDIDAASGTGFMVAALLIIGGCGSFVFHLLFMRELAFITNQKFVLWAAYANIIGAITSFIIIGVFIELAGLILLFMAFYQMKEIRKRTQSDVMPWFPK